MFKMLKPKVGVTVIYHPYEEGASDAQSLLLKSMDLLVDLGLDTVTAKELVHDTETAIEAGKIFKEENVDLLCLPLATWSSDYTVLDLLEQIDVPVITWAFPGVNTGSLCGVQQIDCVLKELNKEYKFVYGDNEKSYQEILSYSKAVALKNKMRHTRLGLIGYRISGMTEVTFDEFALKSVFGPRVIHLGIDDLKIQTETISDDEPRILWEKVKEKVGKVISNEDNGIYSSKIYLVLKKFIQDHGLSGIATECYPKLMGQVCLAHSLLSEEGVVASCEGDINSALAMLILHELTGLPVHNTDLLAVYENDNSILFSHCGSGGFSLAEKMEDICLSSVRLAKAGVCVLFPSKPGEVTMINLVGRKDTYRMCIVKGEAVNTEMVFPGNPIRVRIPIEINDFLEIIAEKGFGHHWMIVYGDVIKDLINLASLMGIQAIPIF
jgi:L-fucose isomerase-like protein